VARQEEILRLEAAGNHPLGVRGGEAVGDGRSPIDSLPPRQRPLLPALAKRLPFPQLPHPVSACSPATAIQHSQHAPSAQLPPHRGSPPLTPRFWRASGSRASRHLLVATSRPTRVSSARYTSPTPPLRSGATTR